MATKFIFFKTRLVRYPLLAICTSAALLITGLASELSKSDWATWVGSIGTIGTLAGTIWIASTETRRRKRQESARSVIVAAALAPRLEQLAAQVGCFQTRFIFRNLENGLLLTPAEESADFLSIEFAGASTDELIAMEEMPNNCATKLAYAQAQLLIVRTEVRRYVETTNVQAGPLPFDVAKSWCNSARDLTERFTVLARQCRQAAKTHAAPPTRSELYGDVDDDDFS